MSIHIRKVGEVADGSVTEVKLGDGAVTEVKLADASVSNTKLADGGVSTAKIQDNAISTAKAVAALKRHVYTGDETEVSVTGTTETEVKTFIIAISSANLSWTVLRAQAMLKTSDALHAATMKIYVDDEISPRITLSSTSATYELLSGNADISDLAQGKHDIHVKLVSADALATAYNDLFDVFTEID